MSFSLFDLSRNLNTVFHSQVNDYDNFAAGGSFTLSDQVVGIKGFREDLIIFCENSIHKLINLHNSDTVRIDPITDNVGCLSGYSIQEIGGDLLFLAADGFRTVAGTARIGDVELGTISSNVQSLFDANLSNSGSFTSIVSRFLANVEAIIKKINNRKTISVIEDILNSGVILFLPLRFILCRFVQ